MRLREFHRRQSPIRTVDRMKSAAAAHELAGQLAVVKSAQVRHAGGVEALEQSAGLGRPARTLAVLEVESHQWRLQIDHLDSAPVRLKKPDAIHVPGVGGARAVTVPPKPHPPRGWPAGSSAAGVQL